MRRDEQVAWASGRRARLLRVVLLTAAWSMSGAWSLAHALDHAHHEAAAVEVSEAEASPAASAQSDDTHDHSHPEILPAALNGKGPQPFALATVTIVPESLHTRDFHQRVPRDAPLRPAPWTGGAAGPRAPPIA